MSSATDGNVVIESVKWCGGYVLTLNGFFAASFVFEAHISPPHSYTQ